MAKVNKRKSNTPQSSSTVRDAAEALPSPTSARLSGRQKQSKSKRPRVEVAEIDTDEEARMSEPKLSGTLRGLDPRNVFTPASTNYSAEAQNEIEGTGASVRHRSTRLRNSSQPNVNYNTKFHPMDHITRPKRASRITGLTNIDVVPPRKHDDDIASSEDEPSLSDESDDEDESDQELGPQHETTVLTVPAPDAKATRRSQRSEAAKPVNYNRKVHPQDAYLSNYRRRQARPQFLAHKTAIVVIKPLTTEAQSEASPDVESSIEDSAHDSDLEESGVTDAHNDYANPGLPLSEEVEAIIRGKHIAAPEFDDNLMAEYDIDNITKESMFATSASADNADGHVLLESAAATRARASHSTQTEDEVSFGLRRQQDAIGEMMVTSDEEEQSQVGHSGGTPSYSSQSEDLGPSVPSHQARKSRASKDIHKHNQALAFRAINMPMHKQYDDMANKENIGEWCNVGG